MTFSSVIFLCLFMPICLIGYFLADKKYKDMFLCIASIVFYAWNGLAFLVLIVVSITLAYFIAKWIDKAAGPKRRILLIVALIYNLGILFYFKYFIIFAEWIIGIMPDWINMESVVLTPVSLPLGISFYTFSILSYIIDVYWAKCCAQQTYKNVFLYVMLFPKLIQGPIMRYTDFEKQVDLRKTDWQSVAEGIERFIKGLFKKVVIADQLLPVVDYVFDNVGAMDSVSAWIGAIGYLLQLYYDFSGYSDMALGIGKMFGFSIPENFDHPYLSKSISEYWRRWHITLGDWLRDYIYMPVYRSVMTKKNPITKQRYSKFSWDVSALFVTWVIAGVWHGAGLTYLVYGLWNWLFIVTDRIRDNRKKKLKKMKKLKEDRFFNHFFNHVITLFSVIVGEVIFRANSIGDAIIYIKKMFSFQALSSYDVILMLSNSVVVAFIMGLVFCFPVYSAVKQGIRKLAAKGIYANVIINSMGYVLLLICYIITFSYLTASGYSPFLYQIF